jgi:hypothetical protein
MSGYKSQFYKKKFQNFVVLVIFLFVTIVSTLFVDSPVKAIPPEPAYEPIDRFGITIPYRSGDYVSLVEQVNARAVLDWKSDDIGEWPDNIEYLHVLRVSDAAYNNGAILDTLPDLIQSNLGEVWIIGNEPDRYYYQDSVTPEVYAQRYFDIAIKIRYLDPTAKLGFGSVVQPTPIRIRYLERALNYLTYLSCGNRQAALDLIDIWSIHAFILNEELDKWGAGIPVGLEDDVSDAFLIPIDRISDTHSIEIFQNWIINFRIWLYSIGEQEKPLWITEYGSLLPPIDPPDGPDYVNVSDEITSQYMIDTFDFLLSVTDSNAGYQADENHLVQRWFWYSLNEYRYVFGGTLFDPDKEFEQTLVGAKYENYTDQILLNPTSGINPVLYRQTGSEYPIYYDDFLETYNYPYEICYRSQLPLVFK